MKTKPKSDSAEAAVRAMLAAAAGPILPPQYCHLRPGDKPFWDGVIRARARDEWIDADLVVAVQLARCQADIEREQQQLDAEGHTVMTGSGRPHVNPRAIVIEQYCRRGLALMRSLRMTGRIAGDARDEAGHRKLQRTAEKVRKELGDDLLAT